MAATSKRGKGAGLEDREGEKLIVRNRRASHDYTIEERYEGGLVLVGSEVKSMRSGRVDIVDAFASVDHGELWLRQLIVAPCEHAKAFPHATSRPRKVLMHKREIVAIGKAVARGGYTLIPLRLYFRCGRVKVELALAKGKKLYDRRAEIARRTDERETRAAIARQRKGER